jgi:hypothetical protein
LFNNLFSLPAYFVIFSDEFKFTYKTVSFSQTKHLAVVFPMMLLNLLLCVVQILRLCLLQWLAPRDVQREFQFRQYRLAVLGGWFRLGENIRNVWDPVMVLVLSKAIALTEPWLYVFPPFTSAPLRKHSLCGINCN